MTSFYSKLSDKSVLNILIIIVYFASVVLPHKRFGMFLNDSLFKGIPREDSNLYILIGALILLAIYGMIFLIQGNKKADRRKLWFYMAVNITLAALTVNLLFVNNVEMVHFPQYALLAVLLFPLIGNYTATLIWATIFGIVDEAYQYFYLAPKDTSYFDFNDVVTDLIGAVFGLLLLRSTGITQRSNFQLLRSSFWYGLAAIAVVVFVAHLSGLLSIYPNDDRPYHILRSWPPGFWSKVHPNVTYHVIRPVEGVIITVILWIFYDRLKPGKI